MVDSSDGNGNGHSGNSDHSHELPGLPAKPTRRQVTERLARFLALYIEHDFNGVRACMALGMKRATAEAHAHRYVDARRSNLSIQHAMRESGLDTRHVSRKLAQMIEAKEAREGLAEPFGRETPLCVRLDFILARPASLPKRCAWPVKKPDSDKLARGVLDALTGAVFADDSQVVQLVVAKQYGGPERVEIRINHAFVFSGSREESLQTEFKASPIPPGPPPERF
jgi:Holliday junction resolvase RusA-like endonuclease